MGLTDGLVIVAGRIRKIKIDLHLWRLLFKSYPLVGLSHVGRRIGKIKNGALQRAWLYRDDLRPIAELTPSGQVKSLFIYGSRPNVPDYMLQDGRRYRIISDQVGSPVLVVDADSAQVIQRISYDVWGRLLSDSNPGFQPFGFAGGLYDPDTGLVRFGARDYDASVWRWTDKDPARFVGGMNFYVYASNDPVNFFDQDGREPNTLTAIAASIAINALSVLSGISPNRWSSTRGASPV